MARLLYIQASPRIQRSHSIAVANAFAEAYSRANPDDLIRTINLFEQDLPRFDLTAANAKYKIMHGKNHSEAEALAWDRVVATIDDFKNTDKYLFAVPMWNFSIPWRLKQYIDIIVQPGQTFTIDENGNYQGLITEKPALVIYSRGGQYPPDTPQQAYDLQKPYVEQILKFIGFENIQSVTLEPTLAQGPEVSKQNQAKAIEAALQIAPTF